MLANVNEYLSVAPFLAIIPGVAIVVSVLGFNLIGDGLREALDPKLRTRG
jgi:peptide/nickel transport system permease protein